MQTVEKYEISQTLLTLQKGYSHDECPDDCGTKQDPII